MITKQYYDALRSAITGKTVTLKSLAGTSYTGSSPADPGSSKYMYATCYCYNIPYLMQEQRTSYTNTSVGGFCFGTGTSTPTEDDYQFQNVLQLPSEVSVGVKYEQDGETCTATYTLTNNSTQELTITEVALIGNFMTSASKTITYLVDRTLLNEPLTIEPGKTGQAVYTISIQ